MSGVPIEPAADLRQMAAGIFEVFTSLVQAGFTRNEALQVVADAGEQMKSLPEDVVEMLRGSTDAREWATEFCRYNPANQPAMVSWFAAAIEAGRRAQAESVSPNFWAVIEDICDQAAQVGWASPLVAVKVARDDIAELRRGYAPTGAPLHPSPEFWAVLADIARQIGVERRDFPERKVVDVVLDRAEAKIVQDTDRRERSGPSCDSPGCLRSAHHSGEHVT